MPTAVELTLALLPALYVTIVVVHTALQERFRTMNRPVPVNDQDDRLPDIWDEPPSVDVIIPTFNEDPDVLEACLDSLARQDYKGEMRFLVVDDGSSNLDELLPVYRRYRRRPDWRVIYHAGNRGKRKAQKTAIYGLEASGDAVPDDELGWSGSRATFLLMVDSDTVVRPDGVSWILTPFLDEKVAAVTGDVGILNEDVNRLTKLIGERYRLLFSHERAAQSRFGKVFCCAGPFSAYRRQHLDQRWTQYMELSFVGAPCTYGDDLQLTNLMLEQGHKSIYQPQAKALTTAPTTLWAYVRQQWRWNRSFYRQFRWILPVLRQNRSPYQVFDLVARTASPLLLVAMAVMTLFELATLDLTGLALDLAALAIMVLVGYLAVVWQTKQPRFALLYGLVYVILLLPTRIWALCTLWDSSWGTRNSAAEGRADATVALPAYGEQLPAHPLRHRLIALLLVEVERLIQFVRGFLTPFRQAKNPR